MLNSWLPEGGGNLFQEIKKVCAEAEAAGQKLIKLSIGQPQGPALLSARKATAEAVMSEEESMHEYQDNGCPGVLDFAPRFVQCHVQTHLRPFGDQLGYLPIPGIKSMLGLIPLACGLTRGGGRPLAVSSMTDPGYPVPQTWSGYLRASHSSFQTNSVNAFYPDLENAFHLGFLDLAMLNFPHNPSGQIATWEYWREVCAQCVKHGIRLFNDGAYLALAHDGSCCALADIAVEFPELSWMEAYSASKAIVNGTGWRVGAIVGSADFVNDLTRIKGNTDSGLAAFAAYGALFALENDRGSINQVAGTYRRRLEMLIKVLTDCGLRLACRPGAGFFTLWDCPKRAFDQEIETAEQFNYLMIKKTGIVGVHFHPYMRYAVCGPVEDWVKPITEAFEQADVSY
jgi:LL-diaminopimelate aminotransferase